jgi:hypothetical protein
MGKLISANAGAVRLGVTPGRFRMLCRERRIRGTRFIAGRWFVPENFVVSPGTRGPALTAAAKLARRAAKAIAKSHKLERDYDKLAKKLEQQRYPHGELPIAGPPKLNKKQRR